MNKEIAVLKDINFQKNRKLVIGREKRQLFFRQLEMDCQWLESHGVMDYSLLLLIHKNSSSSPPSSSSSLSSSLSSSSSLSPAASASSSSAFSALSTLCAPTSPSVSTAPAKKPLYPSLFGGGGGQAVSPRESARAESVFRVDRGGLASTDDFDEEQGEIYFMAIIDILQPYNW
jgi:1-phosphatidylinositol-4-phosphate 5-kinase